MLVSPSAISSRYVVQTHSQYVDLSRVLRSYHVPEQAECNAGARLVSADGSVAYVLRYAFDAAAAMEAGVPDLTAEMAAEYLAKTGFCAQKLQQTPAQAIQGQPPAAAPTSAPARPFAHVPEAGTAATEALCRQNARHTVPPTSVEGCSDSKVVESTAPDKQLPPDPSAVAADGRQASRLANSTASSSTRASNPGSLWRQQTIRSKLFNRALSRAATALQCDDSATNAPPVRPVMCGLGEDTRPKSSTVMSVASRVVLGTSGSADSKSLPSEPAPQQARTEEGETAASSSAETRLTTGLVLQPFEQSTDGFASQLRTASWRDPFGDGSSSGHSLFGDFSTDGFSASFPTSVNGEQLGQMISSSPKPGSKPSPACRTTSFSGMFSRLSSSTAVAASATTDRSPTSIPLGTDMAEQSLASPPKSAGASGMAEVAADGTILIADCTAKSDASCKRWSYSRFEVANGGAVASADSPLAPQNIRSSKEPEATQRDSSPSLFLATGANTMHPSSDSGSAWRNLSVTSNDDSVGSHELFGDGEDSMPICGAEISSGETPSDPATTSGMASKRPASPRPDEPPPQQSRMMPQLGAFVLTSHMTGSGPNASLKAIDGCVRDLDVPGPSATASEVLGSTVEMPSPRPSLEAMAFVGRRDGAAAHSGEEADDQSEVDDQSAVRSANSVTEHRGLVRDNASGDLSAGSHARHDEYVATNISHAPGASGGSPQGGEEADSQHLFTTALENDDADTFSSSASAVGTPSATPAAAQAAKHDRRASTPTRRTATRATPASAHSNNRTASATTPCCTSPPVATPVATRSSRRIGSSNATSDPERGLVGSHADHFATHAETEATRRSSRCASVAHTRTAVTPTAPDLDVAHQADVPVAGHRITPASARATRAACSSPTLPVPRADDLCTPASSRSIRATRRSLLALSREDGEISEGPSVQPTPARQGSVSADGRSLHSHPPALISNSLSQPTSISVEASPGPQSTVHAHSCSHESPSMVASSCPMPNRASIRRPMRGPSEVDRREKLSNGYKSSHGEKVDESDSRHVELPVCPGRTSPTCGSPHDTQDAYDMASERCSIPYHTAKLVRSGLAAQRSWDPGALETPSLTDKAVALPPENDPHATDKARRTPEPPEQGKGGDEDAIIHGRLCNQASPNLEPPIQAGLSHSHVESSKHVAIPNSDGTSLPGSPSGVSGGKPFRIRKRPATPIGLLPDELQNSSSREVASGEHLIDGSAASVAAASPRNIQRTEVAPTSPRRLVLPSGELGRPNKGDTGVGDAGSSVRVTSTDLTSEECLEEVPREDSFCDSDDEMLTVTEIRALARQQQGASHRLPSTSEVGRVPPSQTSQLGKRTTEQCQDPTAAIAPTELERMKAQTRCILQKRPRVPPLHDPSRRPAKKCLSPIHHPLDPFLEAEIERDGEEAFIERTHRGALWAARMTLGSDQQA